MRWSIVFVSVFVIVMMVFVLQWSNNYATHVGVGKYYTVWLDGFYDVEYHTNLHRWSMPQATIRFPTINQGWNVGTLDLQNGHSADIDRVAVLITITTNQQMRFVVQSPRIRHYQILLPPRGCIIRRC